jgi:hypothetical protein
MVKDCDDENIERPQTKSKGCPMEIQKSFMCELYLQSVM